MTTWRTLRSRIVLPIAIAAAVVVWFLIISSSVERARAACIDRGGQITLDLDERGVSYVQWCVVPGATRERI
ncbi:MAG TPA: hypothetical protein VFI15_11100 [Candidatus Limnocylindrales bacterium]|nr:hypothetical protein [Candidatus Limnocylindrales bacterium]